MSDDEKSCENPECTEHSEEVPTWKNGLDAAIDATYSRGEQMEAAGEQPVALCLFMVGNRGALSLQTSGVGNSTTLDLVLAEVAAQVADLLYERAIKEATPEMRAMLEKLYADNRSE